MGFKKGNKEGKKFSPDNQPEKNGRKPKLPELDKLLDKVLGEEKGDKTAMEEILTSLYQKAAKGDVRAAEVLLNRAYGMAKQSIDLKGDIITHPPTINVLPPSK